MVFAALAVWILGLAVPVTASYIISAVMVVPALTTVGVAPAAAHMFIFYYAVLSEVSPPTALAPFAAAALTGGRPFRTMMLTWKYTLPAFLVPFAFTLDPRGLGLLLQGSWVGHRVSSGRRRRSVSPGWRWAWAGGGPAVHQPGFAFWRRLGGLLLFHPAPIADIVGSRLGASLAAGCAVDAVSARSARPATVVFLLSLCAPVLPV